MVILRRRGTVVVVGLFGGAGRALDPAQVEPTVPLALRVGRYSRRPAH